MLYFSHPSYILCNNLLCFLYYSLHSIIIILFYHASVHFLLFNYFSCIIQILHHNIAKIFPIQLYFLNLYVPLFILKIILIQISFSLSFVDNMLHVYLFLLMLFLMIMLVLLFHNIFHLMFNTTIQNLHTFFLLFNHFLFLFYL